ncbi:methylated-DNA--[protein]-cysteine S-methyltransferase [Cellulomonas phragmiteti]|uniref:Methylated-DNA--protein-cysteine methyltransferase n=1 Tax=Cellulomonas phragmiteti TaxID=478780 RepID=A0ABQ4DJ59_9CELL|nr:methylated-DNA--[protein]-cysteine S-methyltransferase [Cellulomonas phragmiteti]GIG39384.1 methylated-DNA--protein-cysteine methyltransferase [Cellulomonas phragmiteti]
MTTQITERGTGGGAGDDRVLRDLHARLVDSAQTAGLLDVTYRVVDTPVGRLLVAAGERGVLRVAFDVQGHEAALEELAARVSPRVLEGGRRLDPVLRELDEYFAGARRAFDVAVDLRLVAGFRRQVVAALPTVAYGTTASYTEVAGVAGSPRAARAVGTACARNPVPVLLPCHRVVCAGGSPGRYAGGAAAKGTLLELERRGVTG